MRVRELSLAVVTSIVALGALAAPAADLTLRLDARDVARKRVHVDLALPVKPGPLTLTFPKWIPGEHGPTGPLASIIGLEFKASGQILTWTHDPLDLYALSLQIPAGVRSLEVSMDSGLPIDGDGFSAAPTSTEQLAVLAWNQFVLLPKGRNADNITVAVTIVPPTGWHAASSLELQPAGGGALKSEPVSVTQLVDSPVQLGRYTRSVDLTGSAPRADLKHTIAIAAESAAALAIPEGFAQGYSNLVAEAGALFGSRMYRHYTWLLTLSDHVAQFGLEHHESSDNRRKERALLEPEMIRNVAGLLGHEYVHSWNGKYRRPQGLMSPDFQRPMDGSLLWVYEGMTEYWGDVLPARAGIVPANEYRENLAAYAGNFDVQPGARWRPLADTATAAQILYEAPDAWAMSRRGTDFYEASVFLWLDVDAEIRARSHGRASLDDFVKRFNAGESGAPALKPYGEQEIYDDLAAVAPGEWRSFVHRHLDQTGTSALLAGLQHSGWKLAYTPEKNTWIEDRQKRGKYIDRRWSIGLVVDDKDAVLDVVEDRAAGRAGAAPGMKLVAVNGRKFSVEVLDAAIDEAKESKKPVELLVENDEYYRTLPVEYFDGPRYPHLTRIENQPDVLSAVLTSRTR